MFVWIPLNLPPRKIRTILTNCMKTYEWGHDFWSTLLAIYIHKTCPLMSQTTCQMIYFSNCHLHSHQTNLSNMPDHSTSANLTTWKAKKIFWIAKKNSLQSWKLTELEAHRDKWDLPRTSFFKLKCLWHDPDQNKEQLHSEDSEEPCHLYRSDKFHLKALAVKKANG